MSAFLKKEDCMLVVIDIQERLCHAMEKDFKDMFLRNSIILIKSAKASGIPIIVSEQYPKGLGKTIPEVVAHLDDTQIHEKMSFSCYRDSALRSSIDSLGKRTAIICGIETHVCVMQTVLDLMAAGYSVAVAGDAVCSRRPQDRLMSLEALARPGALIYSTESIVFMLMEKAGTELFKQVSPLFKEV
jgi:nicotinamidase-related amidase